MNTMKKALIAAILCAFMAAPTTAQAQFAVFGVKARSGKLRGETQTHRLSRTSRWSKVSAFVATPRAFGRLVSTRIKAKWNKLLAPKSITEQTARSYISRAVHKQAGFNPKLRGKVRVQQGKIEFNPNLTRMGGGIAFSVPVKVKGEAGYMAKGFIRTDALRSLSVSKRVDLTSTAPAPGIIVR